MHYTEDGLVKITDSALVAYLITKGYSHTDIEVQNRQALFLFPHTPAIDKEIKDFYSNTGEFFHYHKSYRQTLRDAARAVELERSNH